MKQLIFMIVVTLLGTLGVFIDPFWGVAVYYFYAVLRPQFMWEWALPPMLISWSFYVAIATIAAAIGKLLGFLSYAPGGLERRREITLFTKSHFTLLLFGIWVFLSYLGARDQLYAEVWLVEYGKIFLMFLVSAYLLRNVRELWFLMMIAGVSLGYIAYEVNAQYLKYRTISIYHHGYCGLDNNGAGLMLAMGIPLCLFLWEGAPRWWRWIFLALIPVLLHGILMSYSRGAMVALIAGLPFMLLRSYFKRYVFVCAIGVLLLLPLLAGKEIQDRFFSIQSFEKDQSAKSRFASWNAALHMARDHPILGMGPRNSQLYSKDYGADVLGRTIHSQYMQVMADNGFVGLFLYCLALFFVWRDVCVVRKEAWRRTDPISMQALAIANGVECSMVIFCVGAVFLSLEIFELPYLLLLIGAQLRSVYLQTLMRSSMALPRLRAGASLGLEPIPSYGR